MYYVYIIRSINSPKKIYFGYTTDLDDRLRTHNTGGSVHTAKYKPWELVSFTGLNEKSKALEYEKYLKSRSGRSFVKKRFL